MNADGRSDLLRSVRLLVVSEFAQLKSGLSGSACDPVIVPVFKTGGRQVSLSPVGSTPTRFRHLFLSRRLCSF
jgi:hypothetical protein